MVQRKRRPEVSTRELQAEQKGEILTEEEIAVNRPLPMESHGPVSTEEGGATSGRVVYRIKRKQTAAEPLADFFGGALAAEKIAKEEGPVEAGDEMEKEKVEEKREDTKAIIGEAEQGKVSAPQYVPGAGAETPHTTTSPPAGGNGADGKSDQTSPPGGMEGEAATATSAEVEETKPSEPIGEAAEPPRSPVAKRRRAEPEVPELRTPLVEAGKIADKSASPAGDTEPTPAMHPVGEVAAPPGIATTSAQSTVQQGQFPIPSDETRKEQDETETELTAAPPVIGSTSLFGDVIGAASTSIFAGAALQTPIVATPFGQKLPVAEIATEEPQSAVHLEPQTSPQGVGGHRPASFPGEEDEIAEFCDFNCTLLQCQVTGDGKAKFKPQSQGCFRILRSKTTGYDRRVVFRQAGTWQLFLNSPLSLVSQVQPVNTAASKYLLKFLALDPKTTDGTKPKFAVYAVLFPELYGREESHKLLTK